MRAPRPAPPPAPALLAEADDAMAVHFGNTPRAVRSPCVSTCKMDPDTGWCTGCFRTIDEIASWGSMPPDVKQNVLLELGQRRQACGKKPDGAG